MPFQKKKKKKKNKKNKKNKKKNVRKVCEPKKEYLKICSVVSRASSFWP